MPFRYLGKASTTTARRGRLSASSSTASFGSIRTPSLRPSASRRWPSAWKRCSDTITSPGGIISSSVTVVNGSSAAAALWPFHLMSVGIDSLLERGHAGAPEGIEEALAALAFAHVDVDQVLHRVAHLVGRQRGPEDLPQRGVGLGRAAEADLVEFLALL